MEASAIATAVSVTSVLCNDMTVMSYRDADEAARARAMAVLDVVEGLGGSAALEGRIVREDTSREELREWTAWGEAWIRRHAPRATAEERGPSLGALLDRFMTLSRRVRERRAAVELVAKRAGRPVQTLMPARPKIDGDVTLAIEALRMECERLEALLKELEPTPTPPRNERDPLPSEPPPRRIFIARSPRVVTEPTLDGRFWWPFLLFVALLGIASRSRGAALAVVCAVGGAFLWRKLSPTDAPLRIAPKRARWAIPTDEAVIARKLTRFVDELGQSLYSGSVTVVRSGVVLDDAVFLPWEAIGSVEDVIAGSARAILVRHHATDVVGDQRIAYDEDLMRVLVDTASTADDARARLLEPTPVRVARDRVRVETGGSDEADGAPTDSATERSRGRSSRDA